MNVLKKLLLTKPTYNCPKCQSELFFDGITGNSELLACKNKECYAYFSKQKGRKELIEIGSYLTVVSDMESKGLTNWPGIAMSSLTGSKWRKLLDFFFKK